MTNEAAAGSRITPFLMFQDGNAEEAMRLYVSVFPDSRVVEVERHAAGGAAPEGQVLMATFELAGQRVRCTDSPPGPIHVAKVPADAIDCLQFGCYPVSIWIQPMSQPLRFFRPVVQHRPLTLACGILACTLALQFQMASAEPTDTAKPSQHTITLTARDDFPERDIEGFAPAYFDKGRNALAINSVRHPDTFAAAQGVFNGPTGTYDVTLVSLTEIDGESTYRLAVDGRRVAEVQNPDDGEDFTPHEHVIKGVAIQRGSVLQIAFNSVTNGKIPEGNGTAYARGRWRELRFVPSQP
ncbi:MAG: VOC family protein [Planctomycetota bacterium]